MEWLKGLSSSRKYGRHKRGGSVQHQGDTLTFLFKENTMKVYLLKNKVSGKYFVGDKWYMSWGDIKTSNNIHVFYSEDLNNMRISSSIWRVVKTMIDKFLYNPRNKNQELFLIKILKLASDIVTQKRLANIESLCIVFDIDLWGYIFDNLVVEEYDLANPGKPKQYPASDYMAVAYKKQFDWWKSKQQLQGVNP